MNAPIISVVMPVYNAGAHVRAAAESILRQTEGGFEFLALDDGSSDDGPAILEDLSGRDRRLALHRRPHRGLVSTLNDGIGLACGEFIARMDADDVSRPDRFAAQLRHMREHPECVAVGSAIQRFGALTFVTQYPERFRYAAGQRQDIAIAHPTAFIRTQAIRSAGLYRTAFEWAEDSDLWRRMIRLGEIHNLPDVLLDYRHHEGQVTVQRAALQALRDAVATSLFASPQPGDALLGVDGPIDAAFVARLAHAHPDRAIRGNLAADLAAYHLDSGHTAQSIAALCLALLKSPAAIVPRLPTFARRTIRSLITTR